MLFNRSRATEVMKEKGIDILVATLAENVYYTSDYYNSTQFLLPADQIYAVVPQEGTEGSALIVSQSDLDMLVEFPTWLERIVPHGFFYIAPPDGVTPQGEDARFKELYDLPAEPTPLEALRKALAPLEPEGKTIGLDEKGLPLAYWEEFKASMPKSKIVPAYSVFREIRMVKTEEEVTCLRRANDITEIAMHATIKAAKEGVSEKELAEEFDHALIANGAKPSFVLIAFGEKGGRPQILPSPQKKLAAGDYIRWDIGCIYKGYHADIGRTYVFGEPSKKQKTYHGASRAAMEEAISHVRAGAIPKDILEKAVEVGRKAGIPHFQRSHVGHGIGVELYDPPVLRGDETTPLDENMVINIETPYYEICFGAIIVEDTMRVTKNGVDIFTKSDRGLFQI